MLRLAFDRGTVLLRGIPPSSPPAELPGARWDPRVGCHRAPAFRYREIVLALRGRCTPYADDLRIPGRRAGAWRAPDLRPYQSAALVSWDRAGRAGLVVLPTGSGKTRLACAAMAACAVPALCLVPTRALLHQWRAEIARHYSGQVGCLGDGEQFLEWVTVATFESAYRRMTDLGARFGLLVVDEAHHFGGGIRDEALELCAAPRRLGLTATAPADDALRRLSELTGPVVCELSLGDLAGEWLAEFETVVLALRLTGEERRRYEAAVAIFRDAFASFRAVSAEWAMERLRDHGIALGSR